MFFSNPNFSNFIPIYTTNTLTKKSFARTEQNSITFTEETEIKMFESTLSFSFLSVSCLQVTK